MHNCHKPGQPQQRRRTLALATALVLGTGGVFSITPISATETAHHAPARHAGSALSPADATRLARLKQVWANQPESAETASPQAGNTWTVTSCGDTGPGTLRDVMDSWAQDGDTIDLTGRTCGTINLQSSLVTSANSLTIKGDPENKYDISGGLNDRIFTHTGTGTLTLDGVSILQGKISTSNTYAQGGCIRSDGNVKLTNQSDAKYCIAESIGGGYAAGGAISAYGTVTIEASSLRHNKATATTSFAFGGAIDAADLITLSGASLKGNEVRSSSLAEGGAIYAGGGLIAKYSEIIDNHATISGSGASQLNATGGGVWIRLNTGDLNWIRNTTIAENSSGPGAGLFLEGSSTSPTAAQTLIQNSTIANNHAYDSTATSAGALRIGHKTRILNSTISGNIEETANQPKYGHGPGIFIDGQVPLELSSTIVAGNVVMKDNGPAGGFDVTSYTADDTPVPVTGSHNLIVRQGMISQANPAITSDPKLQPLADNGGLTLTMALPADSPAIDVGITNGFATDQRGQGFTRSWGGAADIGAFEYEFIPVIFSDGFE